MNLLQKNITLVYAYRSSNSNYQNSLKNTQKILNHTKVSADKVDPNVTYARDEFTTDD